MWLILFNTNPPIRSGLHIWFSEPFEYVSWEVSAMDLDREVEDMEALSELERTDEGSSDNDAAEEEEDEVSKQRRIFSL